MLVHVLGHQYICKASKHTVRVNNHLPVLDFSLDSYPVDPGRPYAYVVSDDLVVL
jgi:hypothetical protein